MVFEKFVVQLLDKYLSKYIDNLDYTKLKIDMWSGNVELENLYLKPNALAELNLPVIIKTGYLKKLTLQIPWKNLYTSPTKCTIDGFYMLVIPKIEVEYDAKQDENEQHKAKMKEVEKLEKFRKEKEGLGNKTEDNDDTFGARMKLQIIQNLELSIHNIHIVYEDKTTKPNQPFSFGITLNSMTLQTTNDKWVPTIIDQNTPVIHKLGELNALAIYWNTNIKLNSNESIENLQAKIAIDHTQPPKDMAYIFQPFNVKAKLMMTLKPRQQNFEKPMFHISIDLEHINLNLNRAQYLDILDLLEYQDYLTAKLKYVRYRPKRFNNTIEKWKFACNAIVNEIIKPRLECYQWKNIKNHSNYCKEYRSIYYQGLLGKINDDQKQRAEELEKKLDVFNLTYIRRRAQIEVQKKKQQEPKTFWNSISSWWGSQSNQANSQFDLEKVLSDEEKRKFYESIGYEGEDTSTSTYPKEYVDIDLKIRLVMLELNIWSKINENDQQFKIISHVTVPDTDLVFRRRPATSSALFHINLGSFQVFGISTDLNGIRPVLIQPAFSNNPILLQAEFEINPIDKDSQYRVQIISQSLEIKYNAPTINKLIQCFETDTRHNLQGVRQAAYIKYNDVKQRSILIMQSNVQKVKSLDISIDIQSTYFLLPENGIYYDGCPIICMDMGHITFRRIDNEEELIDNYTQFRLELKNTQLLYSNKNEDWQNARHEENTRLHIIKPITLYTNIFKCIHPDNIYFPAWKIAGEIPEINMRISDTRLFRIMEHIQSLALAESTNSSFTPIEEEAEYWLTVPNIPQTFKTIEKLTKEQIPDEFQEQLTTVEANFQLPKIDLILEEEKNDKENPFLRILFVSINMQTLVKTFDIEFQSSLDNLIIYHEQFITNNNHHLRFLTAQYDENTTNSKKLVTMHILHTTSSNPLFTSEKYKKIENKIHVHCSKLVLTLQLEAVLSLMRFKDNIMKKLSKQSVNEQIGMNNRTISTIENNVKNNNNNLTSTANAFQIEAELEEFRIIVATTRTQMFDVYVQGVTADMHRKSNEIIMNLILKDFRIFSPNINARFQKIVSQQNGDNELLSVSMILYDHPKSYIKSINDIDCYVKLYFGKANIIFLYKYIDQIMGFLDALTISVAALEFSPSQIDVIPEQTNNQAYKLCLDAVFNAPNIIIPINDFSSEAVLLDLGKLSIQTKFIDDEKALLVEHQEILIENARASRIKFNKENEIESEIILFESAELKMNVKRLLYHEKVKNEPYLSVKMALDSIHFRLGKDDYLCVMKVLMENFRDQTTTNIIREQYSYLQEQQQREEDALRNAVIKKQRGWQIGEILENMKVRTEIKKIALTLYLGETHLTDRHVEHNENLKFANVEIELLEVSFRQSSDTSYKVITRIKNFQCDDLRQTHKADTVKRVMDRHSTVDPDVHMLIATLDFKPKGQTYPMARQEIYAQLESLNICIKLDYLMILQDFFMSNLPINNVDISKNQISEQHQLNENNNDVETKMNIRFKNFEVILLENQRNSNSNCLVLNLTFDMKGVNVKDHTTLTGQINDLTIYSSYFKKLEHSNNKYRILQPATINFGLIMNPNQQKIDVRISNIIVNIAPAVFRILIGVSNSLGETQLTKKQEEFDIQTMFNDKSLDEANFWFIKDEDDNFSLDDQSVDGKSETRLVQELVLTLDTIDLKLDVGFDLITKSVVAMCLSNWTVDLENWSDKMTLLSTMDVEAALYNEHTLSWEPLIEPINNTYDTRLVPWNLTCSIIPVSRHRKSIQKKAVSGLNAKQLITIRTQQLLNLTITKTGVNVMTNLLSVLTDIYNQRLPKDIDYNKPMLSLLNATGKSIFINKLNGLEFTGVPTWTSKFLEENESISLTVSSEQSSSAYRLSVIAEQTLNNRQEFFVQINNYTKLISINRTWQRIYNVECSHPFQILCDTQLHNNQRRVILGSIVKIFNTTTFPLMILDFNSITGKTYHRIENNTDYYVPMDLLYENSNSTILIGLYTDDHENSLGDFFEFDWKKTESQQRKLILDSGQTAHLTIYKETKQAYAENTDQLNQISYCIYIHSTLELKNLLPTDIRCSIDNIEEMYLIPSQLRPFVSGNKISVMKFIIPCYDELEWISDSIYLDTRKKNEWNEQIIIFRHKNQFLRMVLHLDIFHDTYRFSLYNPFWIINHTNLLLSFQIENEKMSIKNTKTATLFCPDKYKTDTKLMGGICLYTTKKENQLVEWSEKFSLDVVKSIGMANCKAPNDKSYTICVDIATSSFGLTKIITLSPAMVIINQTSIPIEVDEIVLVDEPNDPTKIDYDGVNENAIKRSAQNQWIPLDCGEIIPFWPQNAKKSLMHVRYAHNQQTSKPFIINRKHQTLLYMDDSERPVTFVEIIATDFNGIRIIFSDYKAGDAPLLIINHTKNRLISFAQKYDKDIRYLISQHCVYYTWANPLKPREISIASNSQPKAIELNSHRGVINTRDLEGDLNYVVFIDGVQTILLFSDNQQTIDETLNIPLSNQSICRCFQFGLPNIGISIVNDRRREEILYISLNQSTVTWVEIKKTEMKPFVYDMQRKLEELFIAHLALIEANPTDETLINTEYQMKEYCKITFMNNIAKLVDNKGERTLAKRLALDGLWIEYTWSATNAAFYARINRVQIDNQLSSTIFPSIFYPILSKSTDSDIVERPFIELSIYETKTAQSNIMHFKYCRLLIQEFAIRIEQNLILAIIGFLKEEENSIALKVNMANDLKYIHKSFHDLIKTQIDTPTGETQMYFDKIHLSPLKIHVSFLMHGSKSTNEILAVYPFGRLLLKTIKVADMQDVVLKMEYFESSSDRYTITKLFNEVSAHYQNQFFGQVYAVLFGLDILGNPLGIIRGLAEGVESLFYEPIKGAIEGPIEFAEGLVTGVSHFAGSAVSTTVGAAAKVTGSIGNIMASLTFDEEYETARISQRVHSSSSVTNIAKSGSNLFKSVFYGVTGVFTKPIEGLIEDGPLGLVTGMGRGAIGLVAKPIGGVVDFASTSLNVVQRVTSNEQVVHRSRQPRLISRDGLVPPYTSHEAMGFCILNHLLKEEYGKTDAYVAHILCSHYPTCWIMATSKRILYIRESSVLDHYHIEWIMNYVDLERVPVIKSNQQAIEILFKKSLHKNTSEENRSLGKLVKYLDIAHARYFISKITIAMHTI